MLLKLLSRTLLPAFAGLAAVRGQPAAAPDGLCVTAAPTFVSEDMFRGERYGGASLQPWIEADYGRFAAGVWTSFSVGGADAGQRDEEVDPYVSFTQPCGGSVSLTPSLQVYTYPRAAPSQGDYRSTYEPSLALNATVAGVRLTPKLSYDLVLRGTTAELGAAAALPLKSVGTELDLNANVGGVWQAAAQNTSGTGLPAERAGGGYWLAGVTLPFQVAPTAKLSVGCAYSRGFDSWVELGTGPRSINPLAAGRTIVTAAVLFNF